jgi:hypothetical protein
MQAHGDESFQSPSRRHLAKKALQYYEELREQEDWDRKRPSSHSRERKYLPATTETRSHQYPVDEVYIDQDHRREQLENLTNLMKEEIERVEPNYPSSHPNQRKYLYTDSYRSRDNSRNKASQNNTMRASSTHTFTQPLIEDLKDAVGEAEHIYLHNKTMKPTSSYYTSRLNDSKNKSVRSPESNSKLFHVEIEKQNSYKQSPLRDRFDHHQKKAKEIRRAQYAANVNLHKSIDRKHPDSFMIQETLRKAKAEEERKSRYRQKEDTSRQKFVIHITDSKQKQGLTPAQTMQPDNLDSSRHNYYPHETTRDQIYLPYNQGHSTHTSNLAQNTSPPLAVLSRSHTPAQPLTPFDSKAASSNTVISVRFTLLEERNQVNQHRFESRSSTPKKETPPASLKRPEPQEVEEERLAQVRRPSVAPLEVLRVEPQHAHNHVEKLYKRASVKGIDLVRVDPLEIERIRRESIAMFTNHKLQELARNENSEMSDLKHAFESEPHSENLGIHNAMMEEKIKAKYSPALDEEPSFVDIEGDGQGHESYLSEGNVEYRTHPTQTFPAWIVGPGYCDPGYIISPIGFLFDVNIGKLSIVKGDPVKAVPLGVTSGPKKVIEGTILKPNEKDPKCDFVVEKDGKRICISMMRKKSKDNIQTNCMVYDRHRNMLGRAKLHLDTIEPSTGMPYLFSNGLVMERGGRLKETLTKRGRPGYAAVKTDKWARVAKVDFTTIEQVNGMPVEFVCIESGEILAFPVGPFRIPLTKLLEGETGRVEMEDGRAFAGDISVNESRPSEIFMILGGRNNNTDNSIQDYLVLELDQSSHTHTDYQTFEASIMDFATKPLFNQVIKSKSRQSIEAGKISPSKDKDIPIKKSSPTKPAPERPTSKTRIPNSPNQPPTQESRNRSGTPPKSANRSSSKSLPKSKPTPPQKKPATLIRQSPRPVPHLDSQHLATSSPNKDVGLYYSINRPRSISPKPAFK